MRPGPRTDKKEVPRYLKRIPFPAGLFCVTLITYRRRRAPPIARIKKEVSQMKKLLAVLLMLSLALTAIPALAQPGAEFRDHLL